MSNIVNLRRARKQKRRVDKDQTAVENRTRFGRTKAEREREDAQLELDARKLDGAKLGQPEDE